MTYPNWYDPMIDLSYDDQKFIWENIIPSIEYEKKLEDVTNNTPKTSINLNSSVNGTYKLNSNSELNSSKGQAILLLRQCNYKTAPKIVASYLEIIFIKWPSKEGHWLYIAQHYTPKTINSVINQLIKQYQRGEISLLNPAAYFTEIILRFRPKRKKFRGTNGGYKIKEAGGNG